MTLHMDGIVVLMKFQAIKNEVLSGDRYYVLEFRQINNDRF